MRRTNWTPAFAWAAAVAAAFTLAAVAPTESLVMGQMPTIAVKRLDQQPLVLPHELPAERTLALVAYSKGQRGEIDSWIQGLGLLQNPEIPWFRMPVLNDPGDHGKRSAIEQKLLDRHPEPADRARLVPVFTDREAFIRAAGLSGPEHASVLVLGRDGKVLARAEGMFDERKGEALRETLFARND